MLKYLLLFLLAAAAQPAAADDDVILVLGDSLSAAYGFGMEHGWVALLQERLAAQGYRYRIVNASISGDTSRGVRARLGSLLEREVPDIAIVGLGGNDGLRGIPLPELRDNLENIIAQLRSTGSRVLLIPMTLPPNYGPAYIRQFENIYEGAAAGEGVILGRFILDGIAIDPELMQEDGIHPRAEAQPLLLDNIWPSLQPMLRTGAAAGPDQ
jgi:acyl-CoA thioesterase-1